MTFRSIDITGTDDMAYRVTSLEQYREMFPDALIDARSYEILKRGGSVYVDGHGVSLKVKRERRRRHNIKHHGARYGSGFNRQSNYGNPHRPPHAGRRRW